MPPEMAKPPIPETKRIFTAKHAKIAKQWQRGNPSRNRILRDLRDLGGEIFGFF
jgi:hypothetical protein